MYTINNCLNMDTINEKINVLQKYMLYNIDNDDNNIEYINNKKNSCNDISVPRFLKVVDYNKTKCKYNDSKHYKKNEDELFWIFYKLYYDKEDEDIFETNLFLEEKKIKIELINEISKKKLNLNNKCIKKTHIIETLTSSIKLDLITFYGLCLIYNIDLLVINKDKYTYAFITNKPNEKFKKLKNFNLLNLNYKNLSNLSKSFDFNFVKIDHQIFNELEDYYYLKNILKPLNSISSYKIDELIDICKKLKIATINSETNKNKKKIELYNEIFLKIN